MCTCIYNWLRGVTILPPIDRGPLPTNTTHILVIKSQGYINLRKCRNKEDFTLLRVKKFEVAYNNVSDEVMSDFSIFKHLLLAEFLHLVVPGQKVHVYHIPVHSYKDRSMIYDNHEIFKPNADYICDCVFSQRDCLFHRFITEKLNKKYYKNDDPTENSSICDFCDYDWSVV